MQPHGRPPNIDCIVGEMPSLLSNHKELYPACGTWTDRDPTGGQGKN